MPEDTSSTAAEDFTNAADIVRKKTDAIFIAIPANGFMLSLPPAEDAGRAYAPELRMLAGRSRPSRSRRVLPSYAVRNRPRR